MSKRTKLVCAAAGLLIAGAAVSAFTLRPDTTDDPGSTATTVAPGGPDQTEQYWTPDRMRQAQENTKNQKGPGGF